MIKPGTKTVDKLPMNSRHTLFTLKLIKRYAGLEQIPAFQSHMQLMNVLPH